MNPDKARALLKLGEEYDVYEGPIPDDDEKVVEEAEDLVEKAAIAWQENIRGPEVEAVLKLDANWEETQDEDDDNGEEEEPEEEPEESEDEPEESEEEEEEAGDEDLANTVPWADYDDQKVPEIKEILADEDNDTRAHAWEYENAHKSRKRILDYIEELASEEGDGSSKEEEEPEGEEASEGDGEDEADGDGPEDGEDEAEEEDAESDADNDTGSEEGEPDSEEAGEAEDIYESLISEAQKIHKKHHLAKPPKMPDDPVEMPFRLRDLSQNELQDVHSAMAAYTHRAAYEYSLQERYKDACAKVVDELEREALLDTDKMDPETKKPKTVTQLESEIRRDPELKKWIRRRERHRIAADDLRRQRDMYRDNVEACSRHFTMRSES